MQTPPAAIAQVELFARLARGHEAAVTVVTPNRRLAAALARDFALAQAAKGLTLWEAADILPFEAFIERLWVDALYSETAPGLPLLVNPAQEQALWEEALGGTRHAQGLESVAPAARLCREAWRLAQAWRLAAKLRGADGNEDARAFVEWSARYERATRERRLADGARLPDLVAPLLGDAAVRRPGTLVMYGFDIVTPQADAFLAALAAAGTAIASCRTPPAGAGARRVAFTGEKDEIAAAARWARDRLAKSAQAGTRIGVVVPDLPQSRASVERVFASVLHPGAILPGAARVPMSFEISLGLALPEYPLVHDALLVLALGGRELAFEEASRLLRSPFLAGAEAEMAARARLDAAIRDRAAVSLGLDHLLELVADRDSPPAPILCARLRALAEARRRILWGVKTPSAWARAFSEALGSAGFPGDRGLDSVEYQTLRKWHEVVAGFAALERVCGPSGFQEALGRLARLAAETVFQPETPEVPIQVLGVLESAGMGFDHLWVMGLTDEAWPLAARPNPFLPVRLQREAGIPEAAAESSLALDQRITAGWIAAAPEVVVSHARTKGDSELAPSPLIAALSEAQPGDLAIPACETLREAIHRGRGALERLADERGPRLPAQSHGGGTGVFRDQAACPFRAFARHRLGSEAPEVPQPGLAAADRGTLLHAVLAFAWNELGDKGRLDSIAPEALGEILGRAADEAIRRVRNRKPRGLEGRFAAAERERLVALGRAWLEFERGRGDFAVAATERKLPVTFGGLTVNARLDRLDRLAAGGHAVIDYKTGGAKVADWLGARPDEPQLPMYAIASAEDVAAVAFACVKVGGHEFKGLARVEGALPGVGLVSANKSKLAARYRDWTALREGWRSELEALGRGFAAGEARVDPKRGATTCERCDQQVLCRVADRTGPVEDDAAPEAGDE